MIINRMDLFSRRSFAVEESLLWENFLLGGSPKKHYTLYIGAAKFHLRWEDRNCLIGGMDGEPLLHLEVRDRGPGEGTLVFFPFRERLSESPAQEVTFTYPSFFSLEQAGEVLGRHLYGFTPNRLGQFSMWREWKGWGPVYQLEPLEEGPSFRGRISFRMTRRGKGEAIFHFLDGLTPILLDGSRHHLPGRPGVYRLREVGVPAPPSPIHVDGRGFRVGMTYYPTYAQAVIALEG